MTYTATILTEETVPQYLAEHAAEIGVFAPDAKLTAKAILGGNVNYAFCATEQGTNKTIFVKQAPEFVAIFGPDGLKLTSARMKQEIAVFEEWKTLLGPELCAKYLPNIYLFDTKMMVFVMDFLDKHTLLDHVLVDEGVVSNDVATGLGEFMGKTHAKTHSSKVSKERFEYLVKHFENRAMRDIQLEYVFTKCYEEATDEQKAGLNVDDDFMKEVNELKAAYDGGNKDNLSLCHGDLHPGSVMVAGGDVKVIDPEFTVYGPPGLDVGSLLSGYVLGAVNQAFSNSADGVASISEGINEFWSSYVSAMKSEGISDDIMAKIEAETVGFTVAEVCRTALEFAGGRKWLQFEDPDVKAKSRKAALKIVEKCMTNRHENGMEVLVAAIKEFATAV
jgi:5-methylthioribose kinase